MISIVSILSKNKPSETILYFLNTHFIPTNIRTEISRIDFICLRFYKQSHRFLTFESGENEFYGLQCAAARLIPEVKMEELEERSISALTPSVGGVWSQWLFLAYRMIVFEGDVTRS
ncbi:Uncharacterized protein XB15_01530 [Leptospira santarosai]|nr:Uncharacterized protein XB15_01530 [Leptospira santarosai]